MREGQVTSIGGAKVSIGATRSNLPPEFDHLIKEPPKRSSWLGFFTSQPPHLADAVEVNFPAGSRAVLVSHRDGSSLIVASIPTPRAVICLAEQPFGHFIDLRPELPTLHHCEDTLHAIRRLVEEVDLEDLGELQLQIRHLFGPKEEAGIVVRDYGRDLYSEGTDLASIDIQLEGSSPPTFYLPRDAKGFFEKYENTEELVFKSNNRFWAVSVRLQSDHEKESLPGGRLCELTPYAIAFSKLELVEWEQQG